MLNSSSTNPSLRPLVAAMTPSENPMNSSLSIMNISHSPPLSNPSPTGLPILCKKSSLLLQKVISSLSNSTTFNQASLLVSSMTPASISSSEVRNVFMAKAPNDYVFPSQLLSSSALSVKSTITKKESISSRRFAWHLPPSYDLENLHEIASPHSTMTPTSLASTSSSIQVLTL
jgi:hypothetical protein